MNFIGWLGLLLISSNLFAADVQLWDAKTKKCTPVKNMDFATYLKKAMGDMALEVTYDQDSPCGKSLYLTKKATHKRWSAFPDEKSCQCYVRTMSKLFDDVGKRP